MTEKERLERIEWLEERIFYINMADHWDREDYILIEKFEKELRELKNRG